MSAVNRTDTAVDVNMTALLLPLVVVAVYAEIGSSVREKLAVRVVNVNNTAVGDIEAEEVDTKLVLVVGVEEEPTVLVVVTVILAVNEAEREGDRDGDLDGDAPVESEDV